MALNYFVICYLETFSRGMPSKNTVWDYLVFRKVQVWKPSPCILSSQGLNLSSPRRGFQTNKTNYWNELLTVKSLNWKEADQLAVCKRNRGVELGGPTWTNKSESPDFLSPEPEPLDAAASFRFFFFFFCIFQNLWPAEIQPGTEIVHEIVIFLNA